MPGTTELQSFEKKISLEVIPVCSENARRTAKDWKMPKHSNSVALKNTCFILHLHKHVFFCLCCFTVQDVYLRCLACEYFLSIYNLHSFLPSFSLGEPNYKPVKTNL